MEKKLRCILNHSRPKTDEGNISNQDSQSASGIILEFYPKGRKKSLNHLVKSVSLKKTKGKMQLDV